MITCPFARDYERMAGKEQMNRVREALALIAYAHEKGSNPQHPGD